METIKLLYGKSDIRGNIPHKNFGKKSPNAEKIVNHLSKPWLQILVCHL